MIGQKQLVQSNVDGDCLRACIASILELPNLETMPHITSPQWPALWDNYLEHFGLWMCYDTSPRWVGYWIASVPSLNYDDGTTHAIVMHEQYVAWDPSLGKRYRKGTNLLGKDLVSGGYNFYAIDVSQFPNLLNRKVFEQ